MHRAEQREPAEASSRRPNGTGGRIPALRPCAGARLRRRAGQSLIFFVLALVILVFVVLWNFDLHKILHVKSLTQNAGDAAALMAGRWQGITLNLVGDLNIMHALALTSGDAQAAAEITNVQARLCFVGPMIAFFASQQAAKNNGAYRNPDYDDVIREHAETVRNDYPRLTTPSGQMLFPEPYPGCWKEYADMLDLAASDGIAAGPDNARFYTDRAGGHMLLNIEFYEAIAGRLWCWFHDNAPTLLDDYTDYRWWPPLPDIPHVEYANSEIYGLGLTRRTTALSGLVDLDTLTGIAADRQLDTTLTNMSEPATWYCYDADRWTTWDAMHTTGGDAFPLTGTLKPQYDYVGADAAVRVESTMGRLTPGTGGTAVSNTITWSAAAKPFGYLNEEDLPNAYGLVLPAFHDVRLIPVDASSAPSGGGFNLAWRRHIEQHLDDYLRHGPSHSDCWYCQQLATWEDPAFRKEGSDWLRDHGGECDVTGPGPGGRRGGGTRRGH